MKNNTVNRILKIAINVVLFIAIWALGDWVISLITKAPFTFSPMSNIVYPGVAGLVWGFFDPLSGKKKQ